MGTVKYLVPDGFAQRVAQDAAELIVEKLESNASQNLGSDHQMLSDSCYELIHTDLEQGILETISGVEITLGDETDGD